MKIPEKSSWEKVEKKYSFPKLKQNLNVDVAIIGGGITGVISAYLLSKTDKKVALLEKSTIGSGVTMVTTAFVTKIIDTDLSTLEEGFGKKTAKLVWESGQKAIEVLEDIIKKEKIECDFKRCSIFTYSQEEKELKDLKEESEIINKLGFKARYSEKNDLNFNTNGYYEVKNQAKFHPLKFILPLSKIAEKNGVMIFQDTEVLEIEGENPVTIKTEKGTITAKDSITTTYWPLHKHRDLFARKGEYTSYVFEVELPRNSIKEALFLDQKNPYHYMRIDSFSAHDRLIVGGEDHRVEIKINSQKNYNALEKFLKKTLGKIPYKITKKWSGPILETIDGLALIGELKPHQYIATGFSGNGMTYSIISAILFRDMIQGKKNEWNNVYNPHRIPPVKHLMKKGLDYTGEFIGGVLKNSFS